MSVETTDILHEWAEGYDLEPTESGWRKDMGRFIDGDDDGLKIYKSGDLVFQGEVVHIRDGRPRWLIVEGTRQYQERGDEVGRFAIEGDDFFIDGPLPGEY